MTLSRGRKIFVTTMALTFLMSAGALSLIFSDEPLRFSMLSKLQSGPTAALVQDDKVVIQSGQTEVTVGDVVIVLGVIGSTATISYVIALSSAKSQ